MFAVELKFDLPVRGAPDDKVDAITWLIAAFVRNGNLLEEVLLVGDSKGWTVYGAAPARDAFHKANWNGFVRQRIASLTLVNLKRLRIRFLGMVPDSSTPCRCTRPRGFFLFTTFLRLDPPVNCIHCNGTVPLYRLPRP
jgi:predicted  nucleic acid-binding Zn ribbon protein